jgi:hypothetical protein
MRCPVCRAENDQGPQCRRCRAELGLLFALEERCRHVLRAGRRWLVQGQVRRAKVLTAGARALHDGAEARRVDAICALLSGDYESAWRTYRSAAMEESAQPL